MEEKRLDITVTKDKAALIYDTILKSRQYK